MAKYFGSSAVGGVGTPFIMSAAAWRWVWAASSGCRQQRACGRGNPLQTVASSAVVGVGILFRMSAAVWKWAWPLQTVGISVEMGVGGHFRSADRWWAWAPPSECRQWESSSNCWQQRRGGRGILAKYVGSSAHVGVGILFRLLATAQRWAWDLG